MGGTTVEFNYDIVCPWAYIGSVRLQSIIRTHPDTTFVYSPVLLGGLYELTAAPQGKHGSATNVMPAAKMAIHTSDLHRTLARFNVPFNWHSKHPVRSLLAVRLLYLTATQDDRRRLTDALFKAYWVDNVDIADPAVLLSIAGSVPGGVRFVCPLTPDALNSQDASDQLRVATATAFERGAPGVPSFWVSHAVDGQPIPSLFHGQDRLHFVVSAIEGRMVPQHQVMDVSRPLASPRKLTFFWDLASPWSYLSWLQVSRLQHQAGSNLVIEHVPVLVGGLFREIGTPEVPGMAASAAKVAYNSKDMADWVMYWNGLDTNRGQEPVKLNFPSFFPIRSVLPLRIAILFPETTDVMFKAAWRDHINIGDPAALAALLRGKGFDADAMIAAASAPTAKQRLIDNNKRAKDAGCCGVPTFQIDDHSSGARTASMSCSIWFTDGRRRPALHCETLVSLKELFTLHAFSSRSLVCAMKM
ncbi:thioredoxin-like protein [Entophlyctis helioformis]|nr:thioredoxin-like protein [Entophlyctis helioformis]